MKKSNPYIEQHSKKIEDDKKYDVYLNWCYKNDELPMNKKGFNELRLKDKNFNTNINKILK